MSFFLFFLPPYFFLHYNITLSSLYSLRASVQQCT